VVDASAAEVMAKKIGNNRVVVIENVGHVPYLEARQRTGQECLDFLLTRKE
jgi:pimeloyl-ACP methyl ester carboxylesterase